MPYDNDGNWIGDENSTHESPYEKALREGGQERADELLRASEDFYKRFPNGVPPDDSADKDVNWYDYNTWPLEGRLDYAGPGSGEKPPAPLPPPTPTTTKKPEEKKPEFQPRPTFGGTPPTPPQNYSTAFTRPDRPEPYYSSYAPGAYQSTYAQQFTGTGEADRNRILQSVLQNPETMGQQQQDQLFEQQKELLAAQRQQQEARLGQSLTARGLSGAGGTALAGQLMAGQDFSSDLLSAQRDIAIKAVAQNRADKMAALQMQEALAAGDYDRMMGVYAANQRERQFGAGFEQQERQNVENFLQQAAGLRQSGVLGYNQARLAQEQAQQNAMMDFYNFLEAQRNAQNLLNYNYWSRAVGATGA